MSKKLRSKLPAGLVTSDAAVAAKRHVRLAIHGTKKQKLLYVGGACLIIIVVVIAGLLLHKKDRGIQTSLSQSAIAQIPADDYEGMTKPQLDYQLQLKTGHTSAELQKIAINGRTLKSFDAAYAAARGLQRLGAIDKSLQAFSVADSKASKTDYSFHLNYAYVAYDHDKKDVAKAQGQKAEAILKDANLPDTQKTGLINQARGFEGITGGGQQYYE